MFSIGLAKNSGNLRFTCPIKNCNVGFFLCQIERYCISIDLVCDGSHHCMLGDDEVGCDGF